MSPSNPTIRAFIFPFSSTKNNLILWVQSFNPSLIHLSDIMKYYIFLGDNTKTLSKYFPGI